MTQCYHWSHHVLHYVFRPYSLYGCKSVPFYQLFPILPSPHSLFLWVYILMNFLKCCWYDGYKIFNCFLIWFKIINGFRFLFHLLLNCMFISLPACLMGCLVCRIISILFILTPFHLHASQDLIPVRGLSLALFMVCFDGSKFQISMWSNL